MKDKLLSIIAAIPGWRKNRSAARGRKAEYDDGDNEYTKFGDDHQLIHEMDAEKFPLMRERARQAIERKRKIRS